MAGHQTFQEVLDSVESLPDSLQEELIHIVRLRRIERRRELLAKNIQEARAEYARGDVRRGTVDEDFVMHTAYIKFDDRENEVKGYYELATKAKVSSIPDGIYIVPVQALSILNEQYISYRRVTDEEVEHAYAQIRNPAAPVLQ